MTALAGLALLLVPLAGCKPSDSTTSPAAPATNAVAASAAPADIPAAELSHVHWLGRKRLAADPNATNLVAILSLPESIKLGEQTLDKLALAPWRLLQGDTATNGAPIAQLRPLLDDLVQEETHLTLHHPSNQPLSFVLAVRLDDTRAALWQTNLAAVCESLAGGKVQRAPDGRGWTLAATAASGILKPHSAFSLFRTNGWTLLAVTTASRTENGKQKTESQTTDHASRITHHALPFPFSILHPPSSVFTAPSSNWLSTDLNLAWLLPALGAKWTPPPGWPRLTLTMQGDGKNVRTRGEMVFPRPLHLTLESWNIPTNLIHDPLISFSAVRGLTGWLDSSPLWRRTGITQSPNQAVAWALDGMPQLTYFAFPQPGSRMVDQLADFLIGQGNQSLADDSMGRFRRPANSNGVEWADCPFLAPFLQFNTQPEGGYAFGGLFPPAPGAMANFPPELMSALGTATNLVAYSWEVTGARAECLTYLGQLFRLIFHRAQLSGDSGSLPWLKAASSRMGNSVTRVTVESPNRLGLTRASSMSLTAVELHLLLDWLESPAFPNGLHTFIAAPESSLPPR